MNAILTMLAGGDLRSIGRSDEIVLLVLEETALFKDLFQGFYSGDPVIRMRTCDAIEKISQSRSDLLEPYQDEMLALADSVEQKEMRWHIAQIMPRLNLTKWERERAFSIIEGYLTSQSAIVQACSLECLYDLGEKDTTLRKKAVEYLQQGLASSFKAVRARSQKILSRDDLF
jgi:hypothetical protein